MNLNLSQKYTSVENTIFTTPKADPKNRVELEIGDSKQPDFKPQVKLQRWDNEVNLSLRLKEDDDELLETPVITNEADKIKYIKSKRETHFYNVESEEHREGAYELEVLIKEEPKDLRVDFTVNTKGIKFLYQPPLTEEYQNGWNEEYQRVVVVSETHVVDLQGNVLVHRPENVVGSYVVWTTEEKINYEGRKVYGTGQVGDFKRPRIIDANGKEVWGEFNRDVNETGILSVIIPKDLVYPIFVDPTLGYTTLGTSIYSIYNTRAGYTGAPGTDGTATKIRAGIIKTTTNTQTAKCALYTVSGNAKVDPQTEEHTWTTDTYDGWKDFNFTSGPSVTSGTSYFVLAWGGGTGDYIAIYGVSGAGGGKFQSATYGAWPSTVTMSSSGNSRSIYAVYDPPAGTYTDVFDVAGTYYWTAPTGVTSADVECWGGGGGGSTVSTTRGVGGGGGGAYAKSTVSVTPGNSYAVVVSGTASGNVDGGNSTFGSTTVVAAGGKKGITTAGGAGGATADSTGDVKYAGGAGGAGRGAAGGEGGGGGGAGGPDGAGVAGSDGTSGFGGDGGAGDNGSGGAGGTGGVEGVNGVGTAGTASILGGGGGGGNGQSMAGIPGAGGSYGGGGGGQGDDGASGGGIGASGACRITYTISSGSNNWTKTLTDTLTFSSNVMKAIGQIKSDTITLSEVFSKLKMKLLTLTDTLNLTDSILKASGLLKNETINLSTSLKKDIATIKADNLDLTEAISKAYASVKSETLTLTDNIRKSFGKMKSDTLNLTENISKAIGKLKSDTITLSENFGKNFVKLLTLIETFTLSDNVSKGTSKTKSDNLTLSDNKDLAYYVSDYIQKSISVIKIETQTLAENFSISLEDIIKRITLSDTFIMTESFVKGFGRSISETFNLSDTFSKSAQFFRNFTETLSLSENFRRLLNGMLTIWTKGTRTVSTLWSNRTKPTSIWTKRTKPSSDWTKRTRP